ncbi:hypothetical protein D3C87_1288850 [compost metagenome]
MNAQENIDFLQRIQPQVPHLMLEGPVRFIDNVNTQLIDAMMVLQASFAHGAPEGITVQQASERMATVHELILCAWEGRKPVEQAAEIVAALKARAIINGAMRGPRS